MWSSLWRPSRIGMVILDSVVLNVGHVSSVDCSIAETIARNCWTGMAKSIFGGGLCFRTYKFCEIDL